jgi:phosphoglycolate phosphatase-like HAD superfamily hydrolase
MIKAEIQLVIFDFDGVIVESNDIKDRVFKQIFDRFPEHSADVYRYHQQHVSLSRYTKFDYLLQKIGRSDDTELKDQLVNEFSEITLQLMESVPFVKGAKKILEEFASKVPLYLLSVTPGVYLDMIVDNLQIRSYFQQVYGCPPWNKPDAIRDILQKENRSAENTVMIGDSYGDQRAAAETGIHFIGRDSGLGFEDPQPEILVPDLSHLAEVLNLSK